MVLIPMVVEQTSRGERAYDIYSRLLIHQPLMHGLGGQASEIDIHAKDIMRMKARMNQILAHHTGQPVEKVDRDTDRDYILQAADAVEYGLVDQVIAKRE